MLALVVVIAFLTLPIFGEDFFISQDGTGNGQSCSSSFSRSWFNNAANWNDPKNVGQIGPGDTVHICGTITAPALNTILQVQGSSSEISSPITILFEPNAKLSSPCFGGYASATIAGAISIYQKQNIIIDGGVNGLIESTDTGSKGTKTYYRVDTGDNNMDGNMGVYVYQSSNIEVKNLNIQSIYESDENFVPPSYPTRRGDVPTYTRTAGICCMNTDNANIHDNNVRFSGIGIRIGVDQNTGIVVKSNNITKCGLGMLCAGTTSIAGVGGVNVKLEGNRISDTSDWAYNDGIKIFAVPTTKEEFVGLEIVGNIVGPLISVENHPATAWILCDQGWIIAPHIHGNVLVSSSADGSSAAASNFIVFGSTSVGNGLGQLEQFAKVHDNTMISFNSYMSVGIAVQKNTTRNEIYNNLMYSHGNRMLGITFQQDCYADYVDNNMYYVIGDEMEFSYEGNWVYSLQEWKTLNSLSSRSWDANSLEEDPQFYDVDVLIDGGSGYFSLESVIGLSPSLNSSSCGAGRYGGDIGAFVCGLSNKAESIRSVGWTLIYFLIFNLFLLL